MDVFGVFFLLSLLHRQSRVSVVFDFSDSLIDVAPESPMLFPDNERRNGHSDC